MLHIYYGDGKGKTTAAFGLCVRAAGAKKKVVICQFLKNNSSSERKFMASSDGIYFVNGHDQVKFTSKMTDEEKKDEMAFVRQQWLKTIEMAKAVDADVIFFDELLHVLRMGFLDEKEVLDAIEREKEEYELLVTGYDPSPKLLSLADYVTCMHKEKHPYDKGIKGRLGIEF